MVDRKINAPLMMPVSEKYKDMGTIVVGKIESGHIRKGDNLILMPNKDTVEVSAIYNEMEEEVDRGLCGDNVRIRIRGVDDEDISPGFVLTSPLKPVHAVKQFEAQLAILEHKSIICAGYSAVMHVHTLSEEVVLSVRRITFALGDPQSSPIIIFRLSCITSTKLLAASQKSRPSLPRRVCTAFDVGQSEKNSANYLGQKIVALLETTAPICIEKFTDYTQLGRFTLRDEGLRLHFRKLFASSEPALFYRENDCHREGHEAH